MVIDGIDIYWVRLPLAFVWRTSYGDSQFTDTILVKMQSQGLHVRVPGGAAKCRKAGGPKFEFVAEPPDVNDR